MIPAVPSPISTPMNVAQTLVVRQVHHAVTLALQVLALELLAENS